MCGIIGVIGTEDVSAALLSSLKRLEYRGYDSAGMATLHNGKIERRRAEGKLIALEKKLQQEPLAGKIGIGHTRWATHGRPNEANAHPHATQHVAVVHNGIIENFQSLREALGAAGAVFSSETDSEVIVHLLSQYLEQGLSPEKATSLLLKRLEGAFALALIFNGHENLLIGARRGSPLAVGYGDAAAGGEMYLGSDAMALAPLTQRITYLEDGDWVVLRRGQAFIFDAQDRPVNRAVKLTQLSGAMIGKAQYRHFMLKEIHEQPGVIGDTLSSYITPNGVRTGEHIVLPALPFDWKTVPQVTLLGCGTAHYAGHVARYWFERLARLPANIEISSEFRYREAPLQKGGVCIFVSQSGETADTLAALHYAKAQGQIVVAVVNVPESSMARQADVVIPTLAGPEIGVASTKAFTTQLAVLACIALHAAEARQSMPEAELAAALQALREAPAILAEALRHEEEIKQLAAIIAEARDVLYLGRGTAYPMALEGALKLKEISYIHAEGYAAGELKHGPIALIDENVPVVVLAPQDGGFEKTASNVQEVAARGGRVILFSDAAGIQQLAPQLRASLCMPSCHAFIAPLVYAVPVQLLAYYAAMHKGTDIDQPRNLAKSVTVE